MIKIINNCLKEVFNKFESILEEKQFRNPNRSSIHQDIKTSLWLKLKSLKSKIRSLAVFTNLLYSKIT